LRPTGSRAPELAAVARHVGRQLLLWAGVALVLAYLAAPRGEGEWYAGLAAIAIVAWLGLRPRRSRHPRETCNKTWPSA